MTHQKPVLFLDIDGVLVTMRSFTTFRKSGSGAQADPDCVVELNRVLLETGATIVLSSAWRMFGRPWMDAKFQEWGISAPITDFTPFLEDHVGDLALSVPRGREIQAWLNNHPDVTVLAIVDDDDDMEHLARFLVRTAFSEGLTVQKADDLILRLKMEGSRA